MSVEYKGEKYKSILALAKRFGLNSKTLYERLSRGVSLEDAVENKILTPKCKPFFNKGICIECQGKKYISIKHFAEENKLNPSVVYARFRRGLSPEEVLTFKRRSSLSKSVTYNGKTYCTRLEFSKAFNIPYDRVTLGLKAGHTPEQIIEAYKIPAVDGRKNPKQLIEFDGEVYETQKELAEAFGVDFNSFRNKLYYGLSIEEALGAYDETNIDVKKEIWQELIAEEPEINTKEGYELLKEMGLDKNINSAEFDEIEDFELQKWMFVK